MRARLFVLAVVSLFLLSAVFGCARCGQQLGERAAEKALEAASRGKAKVDLGAAGTVDISELPKFLQYPGATPKAKWSLTTPDGTGKMFVLETADPKEKVINHYKAALAGWKSNATFESEEGTVMVFGSPDEKQAVTVTIGKEENRTTISILLVKK
ncbi:MAG: hypothetical protein ABIK44_06830 [candidate division WOR-3 bacterium]